jgi:nucleoside phosphorylase
MTTRDDSPPLGEPAGRLQETTAPTFGLLLEAAFAPHVIRDRLSLLPPLERDEALDALDHAALKWSWLMLGWATENGTAKASGAMITIDQVAFLETIAEIQAFVDLEYSAPVQERAASGPVLSRSDAPRLVPVKTQRLHVVDRHEWAPFPELGSVKETDLDLMSEEADALAEELPLFGEPSNAVSEGERIGEVWIRIAPGSRSILLEQGDATLETLATITRARAEMLRALVHHAGNLDRARLKVFNEELATRTRFLNDIETAQQSIASAVTAADRRRLTERLFSRCGKESESYLGPLLRGELDHLIPDEFEWATDLRDELELQLSELGAITVEYRTDRGLRDKLDRWKRRVRGALSKVGLAGEADRLDATGAATVQEEADAARELVEILVEELQLHPEHYEAEMKVSPEQAKQDAELLVRYNAVLPADGRAMQLIMSRLNFAGAFRVDDLADLRRAEALDLEPGCRFFDQKLERARRALASAVRDFLMTTTMQTFLLKDNRELRQVPFEWEHEQPARYTKIVKKLNSQANAVETAYREFVDVARARRNAADTPATASDASPKEATSTPSIGVITALPFEFAAFRMLLSDVEEHTLDGTGAGLRITIGTVPARGGGHHRVLLALADVGNNLAASLASRLLDRYPQLPLVMLGIAGAVPNPTKVDAHPRLGDVVVSDRGGVVQFDFQKQSGEDIEFRQPPRPPHPVLLDAVQHFEADRVAEPNAWAADLDDLASKLRTARPADKSDVLLTSDGSGAITHPSDRRRTAGIPRVFFGPIASSNTLLKNAARRDSLRDRFGVLAVEMEGSGIADATWQHGSGYLVVRGISDYCDAAKGDDWQRYAAAAAALYLYRLLGATPRL